ncbi:MAG: response regulator [Elusimicrobia bacterium]|nr:response regulator [Elusimicrobiota bacterium]
MRKILAVDDDLNILELYKSLFTEAGYEVQVAEDATGALTRFHDFHPDLLILDVDMPAGGGQSVLKRMRGIFMNNIPIIFSTGKPESVQGLANGKDVFVVKKPFQSAVFLELVRKALP